MTTTSHAIQVDRARKLIDLRLTGLVSPEEAAWIGEELRSAIRSFGADVGEHVTLYDASQVQVVPPATIELLRATFDNAAVRPLWARKVAFVVSTALARMQAQRIQQIRPDLAIFDDRDEAIAWLTSA